MKLLIVGSAPRDLCLAALCRERGYTLPDHGPWDAVVLSLPRSDLPEAWTDRLPAGQKIVCGITGPGFDSLAMKRRWQLLRVLRDERCARENAVLTAEGAIHAAMSQTDLALAGQSCLVMGYGRIGKALTGMLRGLGVHVTVAARRRESREAAGPGSVSTEELARVLPQTALLFNTVPFPLLTEKELRLLPAGAQLYELASPPYGIDLDAARLLNLSIHVESGLPGRYCPRSAAETLLDYLEREVAHHE